MILSKLVRPGNFSLSGTFHEWLLASSCFSCLLLAARMIITGSAFYLFLPWNLFLAFIPYWITWWMTRNVSIIENKIKLALALAACLLFIPNSFYIITDLFHLSNPVATGFRSAPRWFDLLLIFSFAWNGILCGIISLRRVEIIISLIRGRNFSVLLVFGVMWLCAFGIYIGRFLRFNSWDIVTDPFSLAAEIVDMIIHPFENSYAWGMTLCYAGFMTLLYFTIKKLSESFVPVK
ncbi:MAG: DUF1361 domain-containing protein [Ferruginibacter sp.]|nr:DUF1361 domain-containing protein [Chitinophagaceae bacterium]